MKVVQINAVYGKGSTGKICMSISNILSAKSHNNWMLCSSAIGEDPNVITCATKGYTKIQAGLSRLLGNYGFNSVWETKRIISELERIQPDIVHLHNIHGHDCHLGMLFAYFKKQKTKLVWTFHDCWAFTGYCTHFTFVQCDKWKTGCDDCPQRTNYSLLFDRSSELYQRKKELFSGLNLTIVTPSQWLADLVKQSFLKAYPVKVIHNGIDLSVFRPTPSDFRRKYRIPEEKKLLLGVAFDWGIRKGLDVFVELAKRLDPETYQIVLVGTNDEIDKQLPDNILSIHRTENPQELAEIYTAADLFVNPTREEVFGLVNAESLACGTPVVTFQTGGSPECIDETCGSAVACDDIDALTREIISIFSADLFPKENCIWCAKRFDANARFGEYLLLYESVNKGKTHIRRGLCED